tara:strand:- start:116 stop:985 length:870 start_codon:yes stop_codon:yes gene_type:complete
MGGSSSKPSGTVTTVASNEPSNFIRPYLTEGLDTAQDLFGTPRTMYEGSTVVPFAPQTEAALTAIQQRAEAGSPLVTGAQDLTAATMAGDYLSPDSNPYLASAMDAATRPMREAFQEDVMPSIGSAFSSAGRYGSGMQARAQNRAAEDYLQSLGDIGSKMAYTNYAAERDRQIDAGMAAPGMAQLDYLDPSKLIDVGAAYEGMAGAQLQEDIDRFNFMQDEPRQRLGEYMPLVTGGQYTSQSTTEPIFSDPAATYLGYGATGAGILTDLFGASKGGTSAISGLRGLLGF